MGKSNKFTPHHTHEMPRNELAKQLYQASFYDKCGKCGATVWGTLYDFSYDSQLAKPCKKLSENAYRKREIGRNEEMRIL